MEVMCPGCGGIFIPPEETEDDKKAREQGKPIRPEFLFCSGDCWQTSLSLGKATRR